jgi:hypothetical protein
VANGKLKLEDHLLQFLHHRDYSSTPSTMSN